MEGPASKVLQRKLYSWLSSRKGIPLCIFGLLLLAISAFQFGEVLLSWSKERYAAQFSIYHDNIAGTSFEKFMSPDLPIDIVYTWVNGSDPRLLAELKILRQKVVELEEEERKLNQKNNATNITRVATPTPTQCPFEHCIPWKSLIVDATNLSSSLSLSSFSHEFPSIHPSDILNIYYLNATGGHAPPVYAVRMPTEDRVSSYLLNSSLTSYDGHNVSITRGFLSSDPLLVSGVPINQSLMFSSPHLFPNNSTIKELITSTLHSLNIGLITELEIPIRGIGVAFIQKFDVGRLLQSLNATFMNETLLFHLPHAIWLPMTPEEKVTKNDIISSNRFQDNEELRYSLRSVERYAPWIRRIYIVTNGQIPHWLNLDNPRISVVTHQDIFVNKSHLPCYSSPAIESHLHRIPGLSKYFMYLNDDVMFGNDIWPHDFFTPEGGQRIFLSWSVPNCAEGCPSNWIRDKYCDTACNVSSCDWDGGDCINATRPGPVGSRTWNTYRRSSDYCSSGCLSTWVGDRYCDNACNIFKCGYDAGDCGIDQLKEIYSINVTNTTSSTPPVFVIPLETQAMYFNLSFIFYNHSITAATYTPSPIIRTAVVAQKFKILSLTFSSNVSRNSSHFIVKSKVKETEISVEFIVVADTQTLNSSLLLKDESYGKWSFPHYKNVTQSNFIDEVSVKIMDLDKRIGFWFTERPPMAHIPTPPSVSTLTNYTVTNLTLLPPSVARLYSELEQEWTDGDLTQRGFLKKKSTLLQPYSHLPCVHSYTVQLGADGQVHTESKISSRVTKNSNNYYSHPTHTRNELSHKTRRLLSESNFPSSWLPWERYGVFPVLGKSSLYETSPQKRRRLLDTFAESLRYVNLLYTREYGREARKVPAHMPHMINKEIMTELQAKYSEQFDKTSSHRLRNSEDMQYSFSYFYYLIGEKTVIPVSTIFNEMDTDKSGILSVRELRTLLVRLKGVPLTASVINDFEAVLKDCALKYNHSLPSVDPLEYETNYDPNLPLLTLEFVANCTELVKMINKTYGSKNKFNYVELDGEADVNFKMLHHNSTVVLAKLDEVRKSKKKFICLNDNLDHTSEESRMAALILQDFYESYFPIPSQFELPANYRNRFLYVEELEEWLQNRQIMQAILQLICVVLVLVCLFSVFYGKIVRCRRKVWRCIQNCFQGNRPGRLSTV